MLIGRPLGWEYECVQQVKRLSVLGAVSGEMKICAVSAAMHAPDCCVSGLTRDYLHVAVLLVVTATRRGLIKAHRHGC